MPLSRETAGFSVGRFVRIRNKGSSQHFGRGRLLAIKGDKGIVEPSRHGHTEEIPLSLLNPWKGGNARMDQLERKPTEIISGERPSDGTVKYVVMGAAGGPYAWQFFVSPNKGFASEPNRAKLYDTATGVNRAAGHLRKAYGELITLPYAEAVRQWHEHYAPKPESPIVASDSAIQVPPEPATITHLMTSLPQLPPTNILPETIGALFEKAAGAFKKLKEAESMLREAHAEYTRLQNEWHDIEIELKRTLGA